MKNFYRIPVCLPLPESRLKRAAEHAKANGRPRLPSELKEEKRHSTPQPKIVYAATKAEAMEKLTERLQRDHGTRVSECLIKSGQIRELSYEEGKSQFAKGGPIYQNLTPDDIAEVWQDLMDREDAKPDIVERPPWSPDAIVFDEWMKVHKFDDYVRITKEREEAKV